MAGHENSINGLKSSSKEEEFELVGGSVRAAGDGSLDSMLEFNGTYPFELTDHTVVLAESQRTFRFICPVCQRRQDLSIEVWKRCSPKTRREAKKYAFGYFIDEPCDTADDFQDVVSDATAPYIGNIANSHNRRLMENDLRRNLTG